jgi:hypothetical protein
MRAEKEVGPQGTTPGEDADTTTNTDQDAGRSNSTCADGAGEARRYEDIRSYLDGVFGDDSGFAVFALGMNPRRNSKTGKYKHEYWSEWSGEQIAFAWPDEAEEICDAIE